MVTDDAIIIERVFDAPLEAVWKAWTTPEIVKKWWGPEGFYAPSIKIDFRVGGKYTYCMRGPKGSPWDKDLYSSGIFNEIVPPSDKSNNAKLVVTDYFSDENGEKASPSDHGLEGDMPTEMNVIITFEKLDDNKTKLKLNYPKPANKAQFEAMLKSGMEEGWGTSFNKLAKNL